MANEEKVKATKLPHPDTAKNPDGSYDWDKLMAAMQQIYEDGKAGRLKIISLTYEDKNGHRHFNSVMHEV